MPKARESFEELSPEQRNAVAAFRARHRSPEARDRERAVREAIQAEFPPATADPETLTMLESLKRERQRQGLSLNDIAERTGIDRATLDKLENGHQPNPTLAILRRYAAALGKALEIRFQEAGGGAHQDRP